MRALHAGYWLAIWLLAPSRGNRVLKAIFIGTVLKLLSLLMIPPLLVAGWILGDLGDPADAAIPDLSLRAVLLAVFAAPLLETLLMAGVFALSGVAHGLPRVLAGAVIVGAAAVLHPYGVVGRLVIALLFAGLSMQYVLFRAHLNAMATVLAVAVTHGTYNLLSLVIAEISIG